MVAVVGAGDFAVAVSEVASHGRSGMEGERLLEDIERFRHGVLVVMVGIQERFLLMALSCCSEGDEEARGEDQEEGEGD